MSDHTTYPLCQQFSIGFSACEDRLLLTTELAQTGHTTLLLTRRMVLLTLQRIINELPELSGLEQTPVAYWQEVLQLAHQQALQQQKGETCPEQKQAETAEAAEPAKTPSTRLYLATELACQLDHERLQLAFKGLPVPEAMQTPRHHVPVLALSLEATHAHQVIQLLMTQATSAKWDLPVDLPWTRAAEQGTSAQTLAH